MGADGELATTIVKSDMLSLDHQVIGGALGVQFLTSVKNYLEHPLAMLA